MLLEFEVSNFRSYKETQILSMFPAEKLRERPNSLASAKEYKDIAALRSVVIYGANNAGKSNLLKGMSALKWMVINSHKLNLEDKLDTNEFFAFDLQSKEQPTSFKMDFIAPDSLRYEYTIVFNKEKILKEELWIYRKNQSNKLSKAKLYIRKYGKSIEFGDYLKGPKKTIAEGLLDNQLFLSKAVQNKQEQLNPVYTYFRKHMQFSIFHDTGYDDILIKGLGKFIYENKNNPVVQLIEQVIIQSDTGIVGIDAGDDSDLPQVTFPDSFSKKEKDELLKKFIEQFKYQIKTSHRLFDGSKEIGIATLSLKEQSTGTIKFFSMLQLVLFSLSDGDVLIIDELDKSLHPDLTKSLIGLFHNPKTNPKNAQLIFATHDTSLLTGTLFGRDQMYFVNKNIYGASELNSVADYKGVRSNVPFDKWYLSGKFQAVPNVNNFQIETAILNSKVFDVK